MKKPGKYGEFLGNGTVTDIHMFVVVRLDNGTEVQGRGTGYKIGDRVSVLHLANWERVWYQFLPGERNEYGGERR